jgi:hypothetical protein
MGGLLVFDSSVSTSLAFLDIHFVEKTPLRVTLLLDNRTGLKLNDTFQAIRAMTDVCCYQAAASGKAGCRIMAKLRLGCFPFPICLFQVRYNLFRSQTGTRPARVVSEVV